ncbi:hypothetical protein [Aerosakkonema funiforme]
MATYVIIDKMQSFLRDRQFQGKHLTFPSASHNLTSVNYSFPKLHIA